MLTQKIWCAGKSSKSSHDPTFFSCFDTGEIITIHCLWTTVSYSQPSKSFPLQLCDTHMSWITSHFAGFFSLPEACQSGTVDENTKTWRNNFAQGLFPHVSPMDPVGQNELLGLSGNRIEIQIDLALLFLPKRSKSSLKQKQQLFGFFRATDTN